MKTKIARIALLWLLVVGVVPTPALALSPPKTLASSRTLGALAGPGPVVDPAFAVDYMGISWTTGKEPRVRFRSEGNWSEWQVAHEDDLPKSRGRTFSALVAADGADAFQVRGLNHGVRAIAINTTDGPRSLTWATPQAHAAHVAQPAVISRSGWGADESYRFNADGSEKWAPAFYPTQKLVVHHTATKNKDSDPAGTVRAIYRYHAIDKGWGDIGYNFLVDAEGRIYKGRYSGPAGTWYDDTLTGENSDGYGVTAAHVGGYNSGTMGIAVLGTYRTVAIPSAARAALVEHLAWESDHHGLDPLGGSTYVNPVNGDTNDVENISGHRDWARTECPGAKLYRELPSMREDVAAILIGS